MLKFSIKSIIENNLKTSEVSNSAANNGFSLRNLIKTNNDNSTECSKDSKSETDSSPLYGFEMTTESFDYNYGTDSSQINFNEYQKLILSKFHSNYVAQNYSNNLFQFPNNNYLNSTNYNQNMSRYWLYRLSQRYFASNIENNQTFNSHQMNKTLFELNLMQHGNQCFNLSSNQRTDISSSPISSDENLNLKKERNSKKRENDETFELNNKRIKRSLSPNISMNHNKEDFLNKSLQESKTSSDESNDINKALKPKSFPCTECGKVRNNFNLTKKLKNFKF